MDFQKGSISGQFINSSKNAKFEQLLELTGDEAIIQSEGVIQAGEIVANSKDAVIYSKSGEINAEKLSVMKNLQVEANLPTLKSITTVENSKFLLTKKSKTPELRKVENRGDSTLSLGSSKLETLQNDFSGHLYLESSEKLTRLRNFSSLNGKVALKGIFSAVDNLSVNCNTQLVLLFGTRFTKARNFYVDRRSVVDLHNDAFSNLNGITNNGNMILRGWTTQTGLFLRGAYKASRGAILQMEEGSKISANNFDNRGTIQSQYSLDITQHGSVTRW